MPFQATITGRVVEGSDVIVTAQRRLPTPGEGIEQRQVVQAVIALAAWQAASAAGKRQLIHDALKAAFLGPEGPLVDHAFDGDVTIT